MASYLTAVRFGLGPRPSGPRRHWDVCPPSSFARLSATVLPGAASLVVSGERSEYADHCITGVRRPCLSPRPPPATLSSDLALARPSAASPGPCVGPSSLLRPNLPLNHLHCTECSLLSRIMSRLGMVSPSFVNSDAVGPDLRLYPSWSATPSLLAWLVLSL